MSEPINDLGDMTLKEWQEHLANCVGCSLCEGENN